MAKKKYSFLYRFKIAADKNDSAVKKISGKIPVSKDPKIGSRVPKLRLAGFDSGISFEKVHKFKFGVQEDELQGNISKFVVFYLAIFVILFTFLGRLFFLTVIFGANNRSLADGNRIRIVHIEAKRGRILDRNGVVLAASKRVYFLKKGQRVLPISQSQAGDLEKQGMAGENTEGPLGKIETKVVRDYPLGSVTAHVVGYTSVTTADDLKDNSQLVIGDSVGRSGIEASYDNVLSGIDGKELVEVDAKGSKVSILGRSDPIDGKDVYLAIDSSMQKMAFDSLSKAAQKVNSKKGSLIVTNPQTGEVLTMISLPSFDATNINNSLTDPDKPLFNRAVLGTYPPGSVFKLVTALAGLESGKINKDTEIEDVGEFYLGDIKFSNWFYNEYGGRDGSIKVDRAIARSNDIFFFRLAQQEGLDPIRQMALRLGFGQKTGIDLGSESVGLVPDSVWKQSALGEPWFPGDTMHMGIGQGFLLATPMQINSLTDFVASGRRMKPYLVAKIGGSSQVKIDNKVLAQRIVLADNLGLVRDGMRQACKQGGTAFPFFDAKYDVGCKTGTAEKFEGNPHAWFTVFAPFDNATLAVTVMIEDGGEGSVVAAPVAREILDWVFSQSGK